MKWPKNDYVGVCPHALCIGHGEGNFVETKATLLGCFERFALIRG
jgi:hypothetical protein